MSEIFNVSGVISETTDFYTFTKSVDKLFLPDLSLGLFIQLMIFIVFFLAMKSRRIDNAPAFATASFITGLITIPLNVLGILPEYWWWLGLLLIPVSIFVLFWANK